MAVNAWIRDLETSLNCCLGVYQHYKTGEAKVFVIGKLKNDFTEWLNFLENCADNGEYLIGFNSISFDAVLECALLDNRAKLEGLDPEVITEKIYKKAQSIIDQQEFGDRFSGKPEWLMPIKQIDVFKINHWDNPARKSSLKFLQFTQRWKSVLEMPIHHSTRIETWDQLNLIIEYCKNDVDFTKVLYEKTVPMLKIRQDIKKKYNLNCLNYSDAKLGSELLLKMYCKKTKKRKNEVKELQTHRSKIIVNDILFPEIEFKSEEFNRLLSSYRSTVITQTKGEVKLAAKLKGYRFDYGTGGIHQCEPGIYLSDELYSIEDIDVGGLYPSIGCENQMYPAHLGPEFHQVFKGEIVDVRMSEKAKGGNGDKAIVAGFKLAANAAVGNTNQVHSWLYDPQYNMQTTINGQLLLSMLAEDLLLGLTDPQLIQTNTDGATLRILRTEIGKIHEICESWENKTGLKLEYAKVKSVWTFDINNYLLLYEDGKIKAKGRFEYENIEPHKNNSFLVVAKGIKEYLINGVIPEDYLKTNRDIFDYCGGVKLTSEWDMYSTCVSEGVVTETKLQKVLRYYVSNSGCKIVKINKQDKRRIMTLAGPYLQTEFNLYRDLPWESYDLNEQYYLDQIYKEIGQLVTKRSNQLELFV